MSERKLPSPGELTPSINKTLAAKNFSRDTLPSELNKWKFKLHEGPVHEVILYVWERERVFGDCLPFDISI